MADERLTEAVNNRNALMALMATEGWKVLLNILAQHEATAVEEALSPVTNDAGTYAKEYAKGKATAFRDLRYLPETLLEEAKTIIDEFDSEERAGEGTEE